MDQDQDLVSKYILLEARIEQLEAEVAASQVVCTVPKVRVVKTAMLIMRQMSAKAKSKLKAEPEDKPEDAGQTNLVNFEAEEDGVKYGITSELARAMKELEWRRSGAKEFLDNTSFHCPVESTLSDLGRGMDSRKSGKRNQRTTIKRLQHGQQWNRFGGLMQ